jgi:hypothetical protein
MEQRFYKSVAPFTTDRMDFVVPQNKTLFLSEVGGDAALVSDVVALVMWGADIIFSTHSSASQKSETRLDGDGVRAVSIVLENNTAINQVIGGYWVGGI